MPSKTLPEDSLQNDNILEFQEQFLSSLPNTTHVQSPPPGHSPMNHRTEDVTLDLKAHNHAAENAAVLESQPSGVDTNDTNTNNRQAHQNMPEWLLPTEAQQRLLRAKDGLKPDLVFVQGAPSPSPAIVTDAHLSQWKITVIEVGFCADLRLKAKQTEKEDKYTPLITELRKRWTHVQFIAVPIGNAGAMLHSTTTKLAELISTKPQRRIEQKQSDQLARTLAAMAARRLYGVTVEYYRLRNEKKNQDRQKNTPTHTSLAPPQGDTLETTPWHRHHKRHKSTSQRVTPVPSEVQSTLLRNENNPGGHPHPQGKRQQDPQQQHLPGRRHRTSTAGGEPGRQRKDTQQPRTRSLYKQPYPQDRCRSLSRKPG